MPIKTFFIQTLGCRVNQYESEQLAALLREGGLLACDDPRDADLRIINTCSVTVQAAGTSRQAARRLAKASREHRAPASRVLSLPQMPPGLHSPDVPAGPSQPLHHQTARRASQRPRVVVTGCWATSDPDAAAAIPGVDAVVGHQQEVAAELARLLRSWQRANADTTAAGGEPGPDLRLGFGLNVGSAHSAAKAGPCVATSTHDHQPAPAAVAREGMADVTGAAPKPLGNDGWINQKAGATAGVSGEISKASPPPEVNQNIGAGACDSPLSLPSPFPLPGAAAGRGTRSLPLLGRRQTGRQRAYLKVQDGCDAHCTYCIIPRLRGGPWSKPVEDAVEEAKRLTAAGHLELVLTGIFLGAYGQATALRRRQPRNELAPIAELIDALCTRVPGLRRLRLSSLEPGDLTDSLLGVLRSHPQVVPHFHLPLQSGSDVVLRRMNRQYTRDDFFRLTDRVRAAFDRPALTTDVIVGFPGETDSEFERTVEAVDHAGFIHVHAFSFSPRPGTAAARWAREFVRGPVVNERIAHLRARAEAHSLSFRRQFVGQTVELLVEREGEDLVEAEDMRPHLRHGRCERYFAVHFDAGAARSGDLVRVRVDEVSPRRTLGTVVGACA